jgi:hypothetical protein
MAKIKAKQKRMTNPTATDFLLARKDARNKAGDLSGRLEQKIVTSMSFGDGPIHCFAIVELSGL